MVLDGSGFVLDVKRSIASSSLHEVSWSYPVTSVRL